MAVKFKHDIMHIFIEDYLCNIYNSSSRMYKNYLQLQSLSSNYVNFCNNFQNVFKCTKKNLFSMVLKLFSL